MWMILSQAFNRARPVFDVAVFHKMTSPGFPSGHAISAVMCFGLLAYLLVPKTRSGFRKAVIIVLAVLAILLIGVSRVFMGDHYLSDVLAGYALGIAWSGLVYTAVELIYQKRINQNVQEK
jgi:undecaprenyl-diphosphatase